MIFRAARPTNSGIGRFGDPYVYIFAVDGAPAVHLSSRLHPAPGKNNHAIAETHAGNDDAAAARAARQDRRQARQSWRTLSGVALQSGAVRARRVARGIPALGQRDAGEIPRALPADGRARLR